MYKISPIHIDHAGEDVLPSNPHAIGTIGSSDSTSKPKHRNKPNAGWVGCLGHGLPLAHRACIRDNMLMWARKGRWQHRGVPNNCRYSSFPHNHCYSFYNIIQSSCTFVRGMHACMLNGTQHKHMFLFLMHPPQLILP